jgi:hypothetical protein
MTKIAYLFQCVVFFGMVGKRRFDFGIIFELLPITNPPDKSVYFFNALYFWAWWASGRLDFGISFNLLSPAYPPYIDQQSL